MKVIRTRPHTLRIAQIQLVVSFSAQDTLLSRLDSVLNKLAKAIDAKRVSAKGLPPGAPPEIPRTLLISQNTHVQIALNRVEIRISPPDHVSVSVDSSIKYFKDFLDGVMSETLGLLPRCDWAGAVLTSKIPVSSAKSAIEAIRPIFDKLVNVRERPDNLSAFNLMFGTRVGGFFRHITVQGYQTAEVVAEIAGSSSSIPIEEGVFKEAGIQLLFDVNNKVPTAVKSGLAISDLSNVLEDLKAYSRLAPQNLGIAEFLET